MKPMFNPSLMCMDLLNIKEQLQILNTRADFFHVDIMDGHYVISAGPSALCARSRWTAI